MNAVLNRAEREAKSEAVREVFSVLPRALAQELDRLSESLRDGAVSEIRLRAGGACSAVVSGRNLPLLFKISPLEMSELFIKLCRGSVHAHRETLLKGYISMGGGVRVGVGGEARYESGRLVGVGDPLSLCFRIPTGRCEFAPKVYSFWLEKGKPNLLVLSPPAGGKTTLLRALGGLIGGGREPMRVVVVDERREFIREDYRGCLVDILSGYGRSEGIEVALRTMSPEVVIVDELGSREDAEALLTAKGAGVSVIASAHGRNEGELSGRRGLSELLGLGAFGAVIRLENKEGRFSYTAGEL